MSDDVQDGVAKEQWTDLLAMAFQGRYYPYLSEYGCAQDISRVLYTWKNPFDEWDDRSGDYHGPAKGVCKFCGDVLRGYGPNRTIFEMHGPKRVCYDGLRESLMIEVME